MDFKINKMSVFYGLAFVSLLIVLVFLLGTSNTDSDKMNYTPNYTPVDEPPVTEDEVSFEASTFNCPQFNLLTASEKEELSDKIQEIIQELIENDTEVDNDILITEFPKCFTGPDS